MEYFDSHVHIEEDTVERERFLKRLEEAGLSGAVVISKPPESFENIMKSGTPEKRLEEVLTLTDQMENLYPFYWIDPLENDAEEQIESAVDKGINGFKVICDRFFPGDKRPMEIFRKIAGTGKPLLFHSGILWDGKPSGDYNRPLAFEPLLEVDGLKFCLAHISWPWIDECIAVYGKFLNTYSRRPDLSVEMFIDTTPGTPEIYRMEALTKLFTIGYDVENNVMFGSDCNTADYNVNWTRNWIKRDTNIFHGLGLSDEVIGKVFGGNMKRFLGLSPLQVDRKPLNVAE
jgi:predicted TIM-barrel fold metal-dependent hydrolase